MRLTKHHGLGNDFLVVLDAAGDQPVGPAAARRLCDRHTGIGADGIIRAVPGPAAAVAGTAPVDPSAAPRDDGGHAGEVLDRPDVPSDVVALMQLTNADGSRAEMSGNGIRCLAQALVMAGWATDGGIAIVTGAGPRTVLRGEEVDAVTQTFAVDMGVARMGADAPEWAVPGVTRALTVDVGNPHLVLELDDTTAGPEPDLVEIGELANAKIVGGTNVHLLRADGAGGVTIRSYERGVGPTLACGTGACASAAAAHRWGLASRTVDVTMPGGAVAVTLAVPATPAGAPGDTSGAQAADQVVLTGPATFVAHIDTDPTSPSQPPGHATSGDVRVGGEEAPCH